MCLYASGMRRFHCRISARSVAARNSNNTRGPALRSIDRCHQAFFCFHILRERPRREWISPALSCAGRSKTATPKKEGYMPMG
jgi:hypothetical protein